MTKIMVKGFIKSQTNNDIYIEKYAIKKDNTIMYKDNDASICIILENERVILNKKSKDVNYSLEFIKNKKRNCKYYLFNKYIEIVTYTKKIEINDNELYIIYDLYFENEKSDEIIFNIKWR